MYLHSKQEVNLLNKKVEKFNVLWQWSRKRWELENLPNTTRHACAYVHVDCRLQQDAQEIPLYKIIHLTYVFCLLYH